MAAKYTTPSPSVEGAGDRIRLGIIASILAVAGIVLAVFTVPMWSDAGAANAAWNCLNQTGDCAQSVPAQITGVARHDGAVDISVALSENHAMTLSTDVDSAELANNKPVTAVIWRQRLVGVVLPSGTTDRASNDPSSLARVSIIAVASLEIVAVLVVFVAVASKTKLPERGGGEV